MSDPLVAPGWYPDPATGQQRWFDGNVWGPYAPPHVPVVQAPQTIVTGPNHAVHGILTLFTFWACGGWAWIWLVVALMNNKRVVPVDAYGRPMAPPKPPSTSLKHAFTTKDGEPDWTTISIVGGMVAFFLILIIIGAAT